jgi:NADPH-dependent glutamate synthase beta subunit-like oxidoreductase
MSTLSSAPLHPGHFVAIAGGAVAGSVAAERLASRGIYCAVFEQHDLPYGKIEDGLPVWHVKLRAQEERKIDERLALPHVFFVPRTHLGKDVHFYDLAHNWGFSALLLANGAWRDRSLPLEGIDAYVGRGLEYQNPLVSWFNHRHEPRYAGPTFEILDGAIVVGGGLASLDVVKILMLETVSRALHRRGIPEDILHLEQAGIRAVLDGLGLTLADLGLRGCTLFYRRRVQDMPLAAMPPDATPEKRQKVLETREKVLRNFQEKYLFGFQELRAPSGFLVEGGRLAGLRFREMGLAGEELVPTGVEHEVRSPLTVSSIGSIPEPLTGIRMRGEVYEIQDPATGAFAGHDAVFALGNVVAGKGNILVSQKHAQSVAEHVAEHVLAWREEDYRRLLEIGADRAARESNELLDYLHDRDMLTVDEVELLVQRIRHRQRDVGYGGDYREWIAAHTGVVFDERVAHSMAEADVGLQRAAPV